MDRTAIVLNGDGEICRIIHVENEPDADKKLNDPAFNHPKGVQVRLDKSEYDKAQSHRDILAMCVKAIDPKIAPKLQAQIDAIDAIAAEVAAEADRAAQDAAVDEAQPDGDKP